MILGVIIGHFSMENIAYFTYASEINRRISVKELKIIEKISSNIIHFTTIRNHYI